MPTLSIQNGPTAGAEFPFDQSIVIGRGGAADLLLSDSSVSRRHAIVALDHGLWVVQDLGSGNGTFVNDRRVAQRAPLANGDSLRVGGVVLAFRVQAVVSAPAKPASELSSSAPTRGDIGDESVVIRVPADAAESTSRGGVPKRDRGSRVLDNMARISELVFDERALLSFVVDELFEALPRADRAFVMLWDAELQRLVPATARTRSPATEAIKVSETLLRDVLAKKEAVLVSSVVGDQEYAQAKSIAALNIQSAVCAPILFQKDLLGVIQLDSSSGGISFNRDDVAVTMELALRVGMALAYARVHAKLVERELVEHDLNLARKIQHHFLPSRLPTVPGCQFAVAYRPALAVGGDLYDFVELAEGRVLLAIGDVSGKGVSAALFAAKVICDLRYQAAGQTSAAAILRRLNAALSVTDHEGMFVTLAVLVMDPSSRRVALASAGHPLPFVWDGKQSVATMGLTGDKPLGLDPNAEFAEHEYVIDPGEGVVLYTDGIIEALNPRDELYGEARLLEVIRRGAPDADALVQAIITDVRAFSAGRAQSDDVTVICFDRASHRGS